MLFRSGIEFEVETGTTVGLLGHNGSGKSTMLKCVAGILRPTAGEIVTRGRVAALLELGAGFHPDMTGRENVFLNASILGLTRRETERVFDEIVAFAELERFIDMQVRHYSSGMYVRLGFAVAVNVEPAILLVDNAHILYPDTSEKVCINSEAMNLIESELREDAKRFAKLLGNEPTPQTPAQAAPTQQIKTLTNKDSARPQSNRRQRALAAFLGQKL